MAWLVRLGIKPSSPQNFFADSSSSQQEYFKSYELAVTAQVPSFIGLRRVLVTPSSHTYIVIGNYDKGFIFWDKDGSIIYSNSKMPGEGVFVKIPATNTIFVLGPMF